MPMKKRPIGRAAVIFSAVGTGDVARVQVKKRAPGGRMGGRCCVAVTKKNSGGAGPNGKLNPTRMAGCFKDCGAAVARAKKLVGK